MFKGKSGVAQRLAVQDARVAHIVRRCMGAHWLSQSRPPASGRGWRQAERHLLGFLRAPAD